MKKGRLWLLAFAAVILAAGFGLKAKADTTSIIYDTNDFHDGTVGQYYEAHAVYYCYNTMLDGCVVTGSLPPGVYAYVDSARNRVTLKGTPTTAGKYSFSITAESEDHKFASAISYTATIAASNIGYGISTTYCEAKHKDGSVGGVFMAGELVTLSSTMSPELFFDGFTTTPKLTIPTGKPGERIYGVPEYSFYMPAQNVSIVAKYQIKNLGAHTHDAAAKDTNSMCDQLLIASVEFAAEHGLIWCELSKEDHISSAADHGDIWYYNIDLDKNGTDDLVMTKTYGQRWNGAGYGQAIQVLSGRNVFGSYTVNIPVAKINSDSDTGLYSQITFNLGSNSSSTTPTSPSSSGHSHKIKIVQAKAPSCESDGCSWHCECTECGEWFWDAAGKTKITNKDSVIQKATGHNWSEWTVVKEATETQDGLRERVCYNNASHKQQQVIPAKGTAPGTETSAGSSGEAPATAEVPTQPASSAAPAETSASAPAQTTPETKAPEKDSSGENTVLLIALGVMAVAAGVLGGILIGKSQQEKEEKEAKEAEARAKAAADAGSSNGTKAKPKAKTKK